MNILNMNTGALTPEGTASDHDDDSLVALKNDYEELKRRYDPEVVVIKELTAGSGEALHLLVTVNAPSHYLSSPDDLVPKACDGMSVEVACYHGYPLVAVTARYRKNYYLASPNVFSDGSACIDEWVPYTSSLLTVVDKLVHDIIHDPVVTRYESMANRKLKNWHMDGVANGEFPTISPSLLYAPEIPDLPPRRPGGGTRNGPPPLPARNH